MRRRKKGSSKASSSDSASTAKLLESRVDPFNPRELNRLMATTDDDLDEHDDSDDEINPELMADIVIEDGDDEEKYKTPRNSQKVFT